MTHCDTVCADISGCYYDTYECELMQSEYDYCDWYNQCSKCGCQGAECLDIEAGASMAVASVPLLLIISTILLIL